jgi:anti-sigma B factor antagonist
VPIRYFGAVQISSSRGPDGETVLGVTGALDIEVAARLREAGQEAVAGSGHTVVLDLSQVTFMDSTGLGALIAIRNASGAAKDTLVLANPSEQVQRVLELTKLDTVFTVRYDNA